MPHPKVGFLRQRPICKNNDVAMVSIFGSTAMDEATEHSDIDLLIKLSKKKSLLAIVKLERKISETLGRKVDLLTEGAISPYIYDRVKGEMKIIYEAG